MSRNKSAVLFSLVLIAVSIFCMDTVEAQVAVIDGLVSFWTFDRADIKGDTVKDLMGLNDGTMQGDVKVVPGKINDAVEFDGSRSWVDCGGDDSLNLTEAVTIELWMMPNSAGEGGPNTGPICKAIANGSWNWQLRYNAPGSFMGFQFNAGGGKWVSVQENLEEGEWHHITGTYDGSDAVCYLNGEEKDRLAMPTISGSTDPILIGQDGWVNVFDGAVDEVRIYDRALSEAEVRQNYLSRSQLSVEPDGKLAVTWGYVKL
jgi:concanavalin A-like lectin/glucanase superfamily protein